MGLDSTRFSLVLTIGELGTLNLNGGTLRGPEAGGLASLLVAAGAPALPGRRWE